MEGLKCKNEKSVENAKAKHGLNLKMGFKTRFCLILENKKNCRREGRRKREKKRKRKTRRREEEVKPR